MNHSKTSNGRWIGLCTLILLFSILGCSTFGTNVATAVAQTQAAWTHTPAPTRTLEPTATPNYVLLYGDDFSNPKSGWVVSNTDNVIFQYSNGQYVVSRPAGNFQTWANAFRVFGDEAFNVDVTIISGDSTQTGPIIVFRYVDNQDYYDFRMMADGYFTLEKFYQGNWSTLLAWSFSSAINPQGQVNLVSIGMSGKYFYLYINGQSVATVSDASFPSGDIGLGVFTSDTSGAEVHFDNLAIYGLP